MSLRQRTTLSAARRSWLLSTVPQGCQTAQAAVGGAQRAVGQLGRPGLVSALCASITAAHAAAARCPLPQCSGGAGGRARLGARVATKTVSGLQIAAIRSECTTVAIQAASRRQEESLSACHAGDDFDWQAAALTPVGLCPQPDNSGHSIMDPQTEKKLIRQIVRQARAFGKTGLSGAHTSGLYALSVLYEHAALPFWSGALQGAPKRSSPSRLWPAGAPRLVRRVSIRAKQELGRPQGAQRGSGPAAGGGHGGGGSGAGTQPLLAWL